MRSSSLKLYAPFIALALVQALFVVFVPSRGEDASQELRALGGGGFDDGGSFGAGDGTSSGSGGFDSSTNGTGTDTGGGTGGGGTTASGTGGTGGTGGTATGGTGGTGGGGSDGDGGGGYDPDSGDLSHCTPDGRQHGVTYHAPACVSKWPEGMDNGGATYPGVDGETIKVVLFSSQPNEQVDAILAAEGLVATEEEFRAMADASFKFINENYELYGRKVEYVRVVGDCPTTPPDPAKCRVAANEVAKLKPFMVIWMTGLYGDVFDIWARNGIISLGGWHFDESLFNDRRPFRYDVLMGGDRTAAVVAEYYCKKMASGTATHAGRLIHAQVGGRETPRKLGIVTPEIPANTLSARKVASQVRECSGNDVPIFTYESDINRAEEQTRATVAGLIEAGVTTVSCMCDPIAPVFLTKGMTQNRYFPEHLVAGTQFIDFDKLGRLYDQAQWEHAFGISHIADQVPHAESDASQVWRAAGNEGTPCKRCNLDWSYHSLMGTMLQNAGPDLNPLSVERGLLTAEPRGGWAQTGGRPELVMTMFGENDYTAVSDFREIYWDKGAPSTIDGRPGAYVSTAGGRRYEPGQLQGDLSTIPVPSS